MEPLESGTESSHQPTNGRSEGKDATAAGDGGSRLAGRMLRRWLRPALLIGAAVLVAVSYFLTYWQITLHAPQYPNGLTVRISITSVKGDVSEVNELNHYIGMMTMDQVAKPIRAFWPYGVVVLIVVFVVAAFIRHWIGSVLAIAGATYPFIFAGGLYYYLNYAGHHLDPSAALSGAVPPFTPAFMGSKVVGQFETVASFGAGFWLALVATVLAVIAAVLGFRRTAHR